MAERAAGEAAEGNAMTEAEQQEAGRTRFLLLPPLSADGRVLDRGCLGSWPRPSGRSGPTRWPDPGGSMREKHNG
jgi:hypothetical protein